MPRTGSIERTNQTEEEGRQEREREREREKERERGATTRGAAQGAVKRGGSKDPISAAEIDAALQQPQRDA